MLSRRFLSLGALAGGIVCTLAVIAFVRNPAVDQLGTSLFAKFVALPGHLSPRQFRVGITPVPAAQRPHELQTVQVIAGQASNGNAKASVGDRLVNGHIWDTPTETMQNLRKAKRDPGASALVGAKVPHHSRELKLGVGFFGLGIFGVLLHSMVYNMFRGTQNPHACQLVPVTDINFPNGAMAEMQPVAFERSHDPAICSGEARQQRVETGHGRIATGSFAGNCLPETDDDVPKLPLAHAFIARTSMMRAPAPRAELGFQVDPVASGTAILGLGSITALQIKVRAAIEAREARDAAAEALRDAEAKLIGGLVSPEDVQRALVTARQAFEKYEEARSVFGFAGVQLLVPDPTPPSKLRFLEQQLSQSEPQPSPPPAAAPTADALDPLRKVMGLRDPDKPPEEGSLLPSGNANFTFKDVAIFQALLTLIGAFFISLTDPVGEPNPLIRAALNSAGEMVDSREMRKAEESAEYAAMLQAAVESGEAPPACATAKFSESSGGCSGDRDTEFLRTRGLDSNRGWISPPP